MFFCCCVFFLVVSCVKMASSEQIELQVKQTVDEWKLSMGDLLKTNNKLQPILVKQLFLFERTVQPLH